MHLTLYKHLLIITMLLLLPSKSDETLRNDCMRDFPLFDYRAEGNRLPWGDYVMIRSFRETTQMIICRNYYHVTIFTDRNSLREGDITASGYTELGNTVSSPAIPSQLEFDTMLKNFALNGLSSGEKIIFHGVRYYMERIDSTDTSIEKISEEYKLNIRDDDKLIEVTVDARWKKLIIRRIDGGGGAPGCPSVYIDQTLDKTLRRIITEFAYKIRKSGR